MLQIRRNADLTEEPLHPEYCTEVGVQHLESDGTVVFQIAGEENGRHATSTNAPLHGIATFESALELLRDRRRGRSIVTHSCPRVSVTAWLSLSLGVDEL